MTVDSVILGVMYMVLSLLLVPERWASPPTILLTVGFYAVICGFLAISPENETALQPVTGESRYISRGRLAMLYVTFIGLSTLWWLIPEIGSLLAVLVYLWLIPTGFFRFIVSVYLVVRSRTRTDNLNVK